MSQRTIIYHVTFIYIFLFQKDLRSFSQAAIHRQPCSNQKCGSSSRLVNTTEKIILIKQFWKQKKITEILILEV